MLEKKSVDEQPGGDETSKEVSSEKAADEIQAGIRYYREQGNIGITEIPDGGGQDEGAGTSSKSDETRSDVRRQTIQAMDNTGVAGMKDGVQDEGETSSTTSMERPVVVITGDAYVSRYHEHVTRTSVKFDVREPAQLYFHGTDSKTIQQFIGEDLSVIGDLKPDVVLIHFGQYELVTGQAVHAIVSDLLLLAEKLHKDKGVKLVVVCESVPRYFNHPSNPEFQAKLDYLCSRLTTEMARISYAKYLRSASGSRMPISNFASDKVYASEVSHLCLSHQGQMALHVIFGRALLFALLGLKDIRYGAEPVDRTIYYDTLIIGGAAVERMKGYMVKDRRGLYGANVQIDFGVNNCVIHLDAASGRSVDDVAQNLIGMIGEIHSEIVVIQLGYIDLCNSSKTPEMVANALVELAERICQKFRTIKVVYLCEIIPRHASLDGVKEKVELCNRCLETKLENNAHCFFWKMTDRWELRRSDFEKDGVHLNAEGCQMLHQRLQNAVRRGINTLRSARRKAKNN